jgi:opacity protein-like surface antigen
VRRKTFWLRSVWIRLALLFISAGLVTGNASAQSREQLQSQELTFSLGGISGQTRTLRSSPPGTAQIAADRTLGINYGHYLAGTRVAALYGEVEFVAMPNRGVTSASAVVAQNYASLYVTPGVRLKLLPRGRFSPWGAIGAGYALYQESNQLSNGQNTTNKFLNRGVFDYGGGVDYRLFPLIGLRGEVRDFLSGNPNLNAAPASSTQHNVVASGGIVLHF